MTSLVHNQSTLREFARQVRHCWHSWALGVLALVLSGCGVSFDSIAQVEELRVLAVQKSVPYAEPGETVRMRMLYHDDVEEERDVQILWLRGCKNPPGDLAQLCFEFFDQLFQELDVPEAPEDGPPDPEELAELFEGAGGAEFFQQSGLSFGFGETFQFMVDEDIITSRPPPPDPSLPSYGLEYVFFAVCAGQLWLDPNPESFPLGCFDEDGQRLGADRFIVGYSSLYVYDSIRNDNPVIRGLMVNGERLEDDEFCHGEACETLTVEERQDLQCPRSRTLKPCEDEDAPGSCPKLPLRVLVDEESVDVDGVLTESRGERVEEQMWVNYHTDSGAFTFDLALVNDSLSGFNDDTATEFIAPEEEGPAQVWAIVRDNRGGVDWARFHLCVED